MILVQILEDLLSPMQATNVSFGIVFVDPWVYDLGGPVFKLHL